MRLVTLNHGGVVVRLREAVVAQPGLRRDAMRTDAIDAAGLSWQPDTRLWRTMQALAATNHVVMLQETHLPAAEKGGLSDRVKAMMS